MKTWLTHRAQPVVIAAGMTPGPPAASVRPAQPFVCDRLAVPTDRRSLRAMRVALSIFFFLLVLVAADYVATGGFYTARAAVLVTRALGDMLN